MGLQRTHPTHKRHYIRIPHHRQEMDHVHTFRFFHLVNIFLARHASVRCVSMEFVTGSMIALLPAVAGGVHRHFGAGQGLVELLLDQQHFHGLTAPGQAFVQAVQAP